MTEEFRGRVAESTRVSPWPVPLRYCEERSVDKMNELDINARAIVVPEMADEAVSDWEESGRVVLVPMNKSEGREA
jgi:hypothetical protein